MIRTYTNSDWKSLCDIHDKARLEELKSCDLEEAFICLEDTYENE